MVLLVSITAPPGISIPGFKLARPVLDVSLAIYRLGVSARVHTSFRNVNVSVSVNVNTCSCRARRCRRCRRCRRGNGLTEVWYIRACEGREHVD